jgi:hypothetical protein
MKKYTDEELDKLIRRPSEERAAREAAANPDSVVVELAKLSKIKLAQCRKEKAKALGITVRELDELVREQRKQLTNHNAGLPHWEVEPWPDDVPGDKLLDNIKAEFKKYIVLPAGAGDAIALWVLHAWTFDAGDISPFLVLVSPEKRCGNPTPQGGAVVGG